jgi:hypothetical protein
VRIGTLVTLPRICSTIDQPALLGLSLWNEQVFNRPLACAFT